MPPEGFPSWLWIILGVILPWVYSMFLSRLPGLVKWAASWGLTAIIVIVVGLVFKGYTWTELLTAMAWVVMVMQAVYSMMVKPVVRRLWLGDIARQSAQDQRTRDRERSR